MIERQHAHTRTHLLVVWLYGQGERPQRKLPRLRCPDAEQANHVAHWPRLRHPLPRARVLRDEPPEQSGGVGLGLGRTHGEQRHQQGHDCDLVVDIFETQRRQCVRRVLLSTLCASGEQSDRRLYPACVGNRDLVRTVVLREHPDRPHRLRLDLA